MDLPEYILQIKKYLKEKYLMMKQEDMVFIISQDKDVSMKDIGIIIIKKE